MWWTGQPKCLIISWWFQFWLPGTDRISHTCEGLCIILGITSWNYHTFAGIFFTIRWQDHLRWCFLNLCLFNAFLSLICGWKICGISSIASSFNLNHNFCLTLIIYYPLLKLNSFSSASWLKCSSINKWMRQILVISPDCCFNSSISDWSRRNPIFLFCIQQGLCLIGKLFRRSAKEFLFMWIHMSILWLECFNS